jgi:pimeloyl-ACP methyl ester carboxylesterase
MSDIFAGIDGTTPDKQRARHIMDPFDNAMTFVGKLFEGSVADGARRGQPYNPNQADYDKHWFAGPDLGGFVVPQCVSWPVEFILKRRRALGGKPRITVAGYSRGAYSALRVCQALGKAGVAVDTLILIDCVKVTIGLTEDSIGQIIDKYDDSFDTDAEAKRLGPQIVHSRGERNDMRRNTVASHYGARMEAEIYRPNAAARSNGSWNMVDSPGSFVVPPNVKRAISMQRDPGVMSRDWTMGVSPVESGGATSLVRRHFFLTHSGMGGMPFRGDLPTAETTAEREWKACRLAAQWLKSHVMATGAFNYFKHPTLDSESPPQWWLSHACIKSQLSIYNSNYVTSMPVVNTPAGAKQR